MTDTPRVQYARTSDGIRIAYCAAGEGPSLIVVGPPFSQVQLEWQTYRQFYGALAESFRVIWFDFRGSGLSQRDNLDSSLSARVRDLTAVIDRAESDAIAVAGFNMGAPVAISYATQLPERVTHLVLIDPLISTKDSAELPAWQAEKALRGQEWILYTETLTRVLFGLDDEALARQWAEYIRIAIEPEALQKAFAAQETYDVGSLVPALKMPTLVVFNDNPFVSADAAQRVAADIPNAEFLATTDETFSALTPIIEEFILKRRRSEPEDAGRGAMVRTVLFTDLVGHTEMMSRLGDEKGRDVLREHERITREVLKANGGTEVKTMGDGFMASFGSVTKAVECAVAIQRAFEHESMGASDERLQVRCGLNAGEPIEEDGDLFGATVDPGVADRGESGGWEILVADTVRGLCSGKGFLFADRGEFVAKGIEEPVRVYEVRWRE